MINVDLIPQESDKLNPDPSAWSISEQGQYSPLKLGQIESFHIKPFNH